MSSSYWPAMINCPCGNDPIWVVKAGVWTCVGCDRKMTVGDIKVYHDRLDELAEEMALQDDVNWDKLPNKDKTYYYDRAREAMDGEAVGPKE